MKRQALIFGAVTFAALVLSAQYSIAAVIAFAASIESAAAAAMYAEGE